MNFSLSPENVSAWREGHVMNDIVFNLGSLFCCPKLVKGSESLIIKIGFETLKSSLIFIEIVAITILINDFNIRKDFLSRVLEQKRLPRKNVICSLSATTSLAGRESAMIDTKFIQLRQLQSLVLEV